MAFDNELLQNIKPAESSIDSNALNMKYLKICFF